MKLKPLFDNLVVDLADKQETTKSGFILTGSGSDKYVTATVTAVGMGGNMFGKEVTMLVKKGDKVLFPADAEIKAKVDGEEVVMVRQSDVLAIVD